MASESAGAAAVGTAVQQGQGPTAESAGEHPGALRGSVTLTLETRHAQRLVKGRPGGGGKPAIIGLIGFAHLLRPLWHGARSDDPYADWWLLRVHQALVEAEETLQQGLGAMEVRLQAGEALVAATAASERPVRTVLRFANPYAYRGAHELARYDRLVRTVLTARHIGALTREEGERSLALGARALRRAFQSPVGYRMTGVTRSDLTLGTARGLQARATLGEPPPEVLAGTLRAPHAPARPLPESPWVPHLTLEPLEGAS